MLRLSPQPVAYRGTVTGLRISAVNGGATESGGAFIDGANASITALADGLHSIEIFDSAGRMIKGVLKAAGSAEGLGTEIFDDTGFADDTKWDEGTGWLVASNVATATATNALLTQNKSITINRLYKFAWDINSITGGNVGTRLLGISGTYYGTTGSKVGYSTAIDTQTSTVGFMNRISAFSGVIDNASLKQVLAPSTSGATIVSAKSGATYNFSYKNASFAYNAASYFVIVRTLR